MRLSLPDEVRAELKELQKNQLDNYHGPLELLEDWSYISASIFLAEIPPTYASPLVYCFAVLVIGCRMRALAEIHHQAAHGSFARSPTMNRIGVIFGGWPVFQSFSGYHKSHVIDHHSKLGHPSRDPDYVALQKAGVYGETRSPVTLLKYILGIPTPRACVEYLAYLVNWRIWAKGETFTERTMRLGVYAAILTVAASTPGGLALMFWYWLVPTCTTACWVGTFLELTEHYPLLELPTNKSGEIYLSRNREGSKLVNWFLGTHHEGYHLVHHLLPRMPQWATPQAHAILLKGCKEYRDWHERYDPGWTALLWEMLDLASLPVPDDPTPARGNQGK